MDLITSLRMGGTQGHTSLPCKKSLLNICLSHRHPNTVSKMKCRQQVSVIDISVVPFYCSRWQNAPSYGPVPPLHAWLVVKCWLTVHNFCPLPGLQVALSLVQCFPAVFAIIAQTWLMLNAMQREESNSSALFQGSCPGTYRPNWAGTSRARIIDCSSLQRW